MALKIPQKDAPGKASALIQLICYAVLFIGIYLLMRRVVHAWYLRLLVLLADYFIVSMVTYLLIRPAAAKIEEKLRKK